MKVCGRSDIGCQRKDNQDSYAVRQLEGERALLVVCDGMGGARAGSVASSLAVETFTAQMGTALDQGLPQGPGQALEDACRAANGRVYALSRENREYEGMGTTLVAALVLPEGVWLANVGDSRGYLLDGEGIRQVTVDHSLVQLLVDRGEITPEEARVHPQKNLITRALGVDSHVECDLVRLPPEPGGRLLLCSDGLTNVLSDGTLLDLSRREAEVEDLCRALVSLTLERGAPDNVTAALAQM